MTGEPLAAARELLDDIRAETRVCTGDRLVYLLGLWGFKPGGRIDPEQPDQVVFMIHPQWTHLQMDVPSLGRVHRSVVNKAIGLIDCVRTHL